MQLGCEHKHYLVSGVQPKPETLKEKPQNLNPNTGSFLARPQGQEDVSSANSWMKAQARKALSPNPTFLQIYITGQR